MRGHPCHKPPSVVHKSAKMRRERSFASDYGKTAEEEIEEVDPEEDLEEEEEGEAWDDDGDGWEEEDGDEEEASDASE